MIVLRPLVVADVPEILPIEQELFPGDPPWSAETFRSELAAVPGTRWYVAAVERTGDGVGRAGTIVGYAGIMHTGDAGELIDVLTIAVVPGRQRAGIGTMLMEATIREATERRGRWLMLDVRADNDAAIKFYQRFGFTEHDRRRQYFTDGGDGIIMSRPLP